MKVNRLRVIEGTQRILPFRAAKRIAVEAFMIEYVRTALDMTDGNITHAARLALIDRSNFKRIVHVARRLERVGRSMPTQRVRKAGTR